jgi:hypothetical protein
MIAGTIEPQPSTTPFPQAAAVFHKQGVGLELADGPHPPVSATGGAGCARVSGSRTESAVRTAEGATSRAGGREGCAGVRGLQRCNAARDGRAASEHAGRVAEGLRRRAEEARRVRRPAARGVEQRTTRLSPQLPARRGSTAGSRSRIRSLGAGRGAEMRSHRGSARTAGALDLERSHHHNELRAFGSEAVRTHAVRGRCTTEGSAGQVLVTQARANERRANRDWGALARARALPEWPVATLGQSDRDNLRAPGHLVLMPFGNQKTSRPSPERLVVLGGDHRASQLLLPAISFRRRCDSRRSGSGASPRPDVDPGPLSSAHAHRCASTPLAHRAKDRHGAADGGTHGRRRGLAGVLEPREPFPVHCALGARGATSIRTRKLVFDLATQERAVRVVGAGCVEGWKRTRAQSRCGRRHRAARRPRGGCRATHNEERERPKESLAHQWTSYALRGTGARRSSEPTPNRSRSLLARAPLAGRAPAVDAI